MANSDFLLPKTSYMAFDSLSLKAFLKQKLADNNVFTDQLYEGSNLSQIIDILSYTFGSLIYYLNRTSTEALFSDTQIYENINRIVKAIGYNPIGAQASVLSFTCSATQDLSEGLWTIPKYSYVSLGSTAFTFNQDVTFFKRTTGDEYLPELSENNLLYQGRYMEHPLYTAIGDEDEIVYLNPGQNVIIDHFNIDVYVKDVHTNKWTKWDRCQSLYLEAAKSKKYEIRLNEIKGYEIKFGNNINGQRLNTGDQIAIYYLKTDGIGSEVGANVLRAGRLIVFKTNQFNTIYSDITLEGTTPLADDQTTALIFENSSSSTYHTEAESLESIRSNAPGIFKSQHRLVTADDFKNYIKTSFFHLIHDVKIMNNWDYLAKYFKYYYDNSIMNPNNVGRVLYNQVNFADSCNFNNVYLFIVPKIVKETQNPIAYLNPTLKASIVQSLQDIKLLTCEPVIIDPVYIAFDICLTNDYSNITDADVQNTELYVVKKPTSRRNVQEIRRQVNQLFMDYFKSDNCYLGQTIDLTYLAASILSLDGVETFYTRRKDNPSLKYQGLSMLMWNLIYFNDKKIITQNQSLEEFKIPYLNLANSFINKIIVDSDYVSYEEVEY